MLEKNKEVKLAAAHKIHEKEQSQAKQSKNEVASQGKNSDI